jgi:hypothetical protein
MAQKYDPKPKIPLSRFGSFGRFGRFCFNTVKTGPLSPGDLAQMTGLVEIILLPYAKPQEIA